MRRERERTENLQRRDLRAEDEHRAGDEQDVLEHARKRKDEAAAGADEEDGRDVEQERDRSVRDQDQRAAAWHASYHISEHRQLPPQQQEQLSGEQRTRRARARRMARCPR